MRLSTAVCLLMLLASGRVLAEAPRNNTTPEPLTTLPWVKGVPASDRDLAYKYFLQGNRSLNDSDFLQAIQEYEEALKRWDHPAIHYNLSLALIPLDRPLEVYEQLEAAMHYGPGSLDTTPYAYARNYKALLDQQLVVLLLDCQMRGASVKLDGKTVFVAPGHYEARVRPGDHTIIASLEGYLPTDKSRSLKPGEQVTLDLKLYTDLETTRSRRRWAVWMPWVVAGGGLALAAGGGLLQVRAQDSYRAFDAKIAQCVDGCKVEGDAAKARLMGDRMRVSSWGAYAVGGGALLTGAVLLYLNRSQTYRIDPETGNERVAFTPLVGPVNGLQASGSF